MGCGVRRLVGRRVDEGGGRVRWGDGLIFCYYSRQIQIGRDFNNKMPFQIPGNAPTL